MELLKQRILRDGQVKEGGVLKVDSFLNHQMDVTLLNEIGREFRRRFDGADITKSLPSRRPASVLLPLPRSISAAFPSSSPKDAFAQSGRCAVYRQGPFFHQGHYLRCAAIQKISRPAGHCAHPGRFPRPGTGTAGPH